ncbi:MAG: hypothetical protein ACREJ2_09120 [Planctomycetota bacterium]
MPPFLKRRWFAFAIVLVLLLLLNTTYIAAADADDTAFADAVRANNLVKMKQLAAADPQAPKRLDADLCETVAERADSNPIYIPTAQWMIDQHVDLTAPDGDPAARADGASGWSAGWCLPTALGSVGDAARLRIVCNELAAHGAPASVFQETLDRLSREKLATADSYDVFKILLGHGAKPEPDPNYDQDDLMYLLCNGHYNAALAMVECGAPVNRSYNAGTTCPLLVCLSQLCNDCSSSASPRTWRASPTAMKLLKEMIDHGADPAFKPADTGTGASEFYPGLYACGMFDPRPLELMLKHGLNSGMLSDQIDFLIEPPNPAILHVLLEHGANPNGNFEGGFDGGSYLSHAIVQWARTPGTNPASADLLAIMNDLLQHGAHTNAPNEFAGAGPTDFECLAQADCAQEVPAFLAHGGDMYRINLDGRSVLLSAVPGSPAFAALYSHGSIPGSTWIGLLLMAALLGWLYARIRKRRRALPTVDEIAAAPIQLPPGTGAKPENLEPNERRGLAELNAALLRLDLWRWLPAATWGLSGLVLLSDPLFRAETRPLFYGLFAIGLALVVVGRRSHRDAGRPGLAVTLFAVLAALAAGAWAGGLFAAIWTALHAVSVCAAIALAVVAAAGGALLAVRRYRLARTRGALARQVFDRMFRRRKLERQWDENEIAVNPGWDEAAPERRPRRLGAWKN